MVGLLIGTLAGCGAPGVAPAPGPALPPPEPAVTRQANVLSQSRPVELHVPAIRASSSLVALGLNPDGTVQVPPVAQPMQAGWYRYGPTPGERGPAVLLGHVNGGGQQGIFARLHELRPGDPIEVSRDDGVIALFTVTRTDQVAKRAFPTEAVYGDTDGAELRLITCGGSFDQDRRSYRDNVIVFARLSGTR